MVLAFYLLRPRKCQHDVIALEKCNQVHHDQYCKSDYHSTDCITKKGFTQEIADQYQQGCHSAYQEN